MQSTTLTELEWVHDCTLLGVIYDTLSDAGRSITLTMRCPTDLGYPAWEGKDLVLTAIDVAVSKHVLWGVAGPETIDAVRSGVSTSLRESTEEVRRAGGRFPSLEVTISFHSGSSLEVVCRELRIETRPLHG
jgi:hypothetical protein